MEWVNAIVQGVLTGGLFALFAAGLSLIFGVMRLVNLAHGDLIVLAAFIALSVAESFGLHPFVTIVIVGPTMFAFGYALQRVVLNRTLGKDILPPLLVTFGLSIIIQNGLLELYSADTRRLQAGTNLEAASLSLGPIAIGVLPLITFLTAVAVIWGLETFLQRTRTLPAAFQSPAARSRGLQPLDQFRQ